MEPLIRDRGGARARIERDLPDSNGFVVLASVRPAEDGPDPRRELAGGEWLHHVVISPELQSHYAVHRVRPCRNHHDRNVGSGPKLATDVAAGPIGPPEG